MGGCYIPGTIRDPRFRRLETADTPPPYGDTRMSCETIDRDGRRARAARISGVLLLVLFTTLQYRARTVSERIFRLYDGSWRCW